MKETALVIRKEIEIEAPPERVWPYVATQEGCRRWFCTVAEVYELVLEPRAGGRPIVPSGTSWPTIRRGGSSIDTGASWPVDTLVRFRLAEEGGRTRVTVIHHGFEHLPVELRDQALREYEAGRQRGLDTLRTLLENPVRRDQS